MHDLRARSEFCPAKSQPFNATAGMASNAREAFASTSGISCLLKNVCQRNSLARPSDEAAVQAAPPDLSLDGEAPGHRLENLK